MVDIWEMILFYPLLMKQGLDISNQLIWQKEFFFGSSLIMADSMVKYKSQGYLGDDIVIKLSITEYTSHGFQIFYLLKNKKKQIDLAHIQTSLVFYNY